MKFKTTRHGWLAALLALSATAEIASAGSVTIPDFSFENTVIAAGAATGGDNVGTNWFASQGNGTIFLQNVTNLSPYFNLTSTNTLPPTGDGTNYLVEQLNLDGSGNAAYCWQDIGALQTNTTYTLTITVGQSLVGTTGQGFIALINGTGPFQNLLGVTAVDNSVLTPTPGTFADASVVFTTGNTVSGDLTILMEMTNGQQLLFDNVRLTNTPASNPTAVPPTLSPAGFPAGTFYVGSVVTLGEIPAGIPPFTYQWQSDNGSGGVTFTSILQATNANYVVTNSATSSVEYRVIVTNNLANSSTSAPVTLAVIQGPALLVQDTLPALTSSDVVGSTVTFSVMAVGDLPLSYQWQADYGSGPGPITGTSANGTTNSTLILTNLQLSDTAGYSCVITNDQSATFGPTTSTETFFTVNPVPSPDSFGVTISPANQYGLGGQTEFTPTWVLATNSLIKGLHPTTSTGTFTLGQSGGTNHLTDGLFGSLNPEGNGSTDLATAGNPTVNNSGSVLTYTLPASANGWDITNIVVYGGWADGGRDQQSYNVLYSTIAAPTSFNSQLTQVNYLPSPNDPATPPDQSATRVSLTSTNANGVLLHNVAGIEFFFGIQQGGFNENGWEGYAELQVFGTPSAPAPVWVTNMVPATGADVAGSSVTMYAGANSSLPLTYQWQVDYGSGPGPITGTSLNGTTNSSLTLTNLQSSDSGTYTLTATNTTGKLTSLPCAFFVNPAAFADSFGVLDSPANQTGNAAVLAPSWTIAPGSLIAGMQPSAYTVGGGDGILRFGTNGGDHASPPSVLTDGQVGFIGGGNNIAMSMCGVNGGQSLTYTLPLSAGGYTITNIQLYGGWNDNGRDEQEYTISYSTVTNPAVFTELTQFDYAPKTLPVDPVGGVPNMTRVTYTSGTGPSLASNVYAILFNFSTPNGGGENGYEGYSEIAVYGTPSANVTIPPYVATDTKPSICHDVVGGAENFTASFGSSAGLTYQWQVDTGSGPVPVTGANFSGVNTTTLLDSNVQLTDAGSYSCVATSTSSLGSVTSTPNNFIIAAAPTPVGNIIVAGALQAWTATPTAPTFTPTWTIQSGSLIAGTLPSAVGTGNFAHGANDTAGGGGVVVLTDGQPGTFGDVNVSTLATCGASTGGKSATYTLIGPGNGYNLTKIVTYGGWPDIGRDEQAYTVSYSTVSAPATFITLTANDYKVNPLLGIAEPNGSRVTTTAVNGLLAANVYAVQFNFTTPAGGGENGWEGYGELQLFGVASPPTVNAPTISASNLIVTGSGGTPGGGYTLLTTTNLTAPLSTWTTNSQGVFASNGGFTNTISVVPTQPARYFAIRVP